MGRRSKLSERQWEQIGKRLLDGEKGRVLAKEYGISEAAIRARFSAQHAEIKTIANQIVATETALKTLPIPAQIAAKNLADDLMTISTHIAGAGKYGAATAHRLNGIAHAKVQEIDDVAPLTAESLEALKGVAVLTRLANDASQIATNLLAANKDEIRRMRDGETGDRADLLREIASALPN